MVHQVRHRLCTCCDTVLPHHQYPAADCLEYPRFVFEPFYDKRRVQRRRSTTTTNLAFEEAEQLQMLKLTNIHCGANQATVQGDVAGAVINDNNVERHKHNQLNRMSLNVW